MTGTLDPSIPSLMLCVAYGLSMDYEVFLLSRVKEEYDRTGDTEEAVATGLQRGAPLMTAAGGILALTFAAYATAQVMFVQMLGVGVIRLQPSARACAGNSGSRHRRVSRQGQETTVDGMVSAPYAGSRCR